MGFFKMSDSELDIKTRQLKTEKEQREQRKQLEDAFTKEKEAVTQLRREQTVSGKVGGFISGLFDNKDTAEPKVKPKPSKLTSVKSSITPVLQKAGANIQLQPKKESKLDSLGKNFFN